jgi:hypothetical protein
MTFENIKSRKENSDDEEQQQDNFDLIPSVEALHQRCVNILDDCKAWNDKQPIEGLYRYTNSLTAEMHFIEKVRCVGNKPYLYMQEHKRKSSLNFY